MTSATLYSAEDVGRRHAIQLSHINTDALRPNEQWPNVPLESTTLNALNFNTVEDAAMNEEDLEKFLTSSFRNRFVSSVGSWGDIHMPTQDQTRYLIKCGRMWTSWIHCAVYYQQFEEEHEQYLNQLDAGIHLNDISPAWLGIYFALLAVCSQMFYYIAKNDLLTIETGCFTNERRGGRSSRSFQERYGCDLAVPMCEPIC